MLAAAGRIAGGVAVPVTVDAEAGYGMKPAELVGGLRELGAAGCNLEDTDHSSGELRDPAAHADRLRSIREAATEREYPLVINARIDVFVRAGLSGSAEGAQAELVSEALGRARAYSEAGADSVYPIGLWERDPLAEFVSESPGAVNVLKIPPAPSIAELAELGVARISWGGLLQRASIEEFERVLGALADS
jgi:2-methylisocitrate lyase-like PEP mutase family enzyme